MPCGAACIIILNRTRVGTQRELLAAGDAVRGKQGFKSHCVAGHSSEHRRKHTDIPLALHPRRYTVTGISSRGMKFWLIYVMVAHLKFRTMCAFWETGMIKGSSFRSTVWGWWLTWAGPTKLPWVISSLPAQYVRLCKALDFEHWKGK